MKLLFDTHAFIWWDSDPSKLSPQALAQCQDRTSNLLLSVAIPSIKLRTCFAGVYSDPTPHPIKKPDWV